MRLTAIELPGAWVIEGERIEDSRGSFCRLLCMQELQSIGHVKNIVQINHSLTVERGMVRGLHFQNPPRAEIKIVRCLAGAAFDVIVDLRKGSRTLLKWHGEELTPENARMIYAPKGFAHGFQALAPRTQLLYFHTEFYSPDHERGIRCDDPLVGIRWPTEVTGLSERDRDHPLLRQDYGGVG